MHAASFSGNVITGVSATLDSRILEFGFGAHKILFPFDGTGGDVPGTWANRSNQLSGEIGRYFISRSGTHGRLAMGIHSFIPDSSTYLSIAMVTGNLRPDFSYRLSLGTLFGITHSRSYFQVATDISGALTESVRYGISGGITLRLSDKLIAESMPHEQSLVQAGPFTEWNLSGTAFRLNLKWHLMSRLESDQTTTASMEPLPDLVLSFGAPI